MPRKNIKRPRLNSRKRRKLRAKDIAEGLGSSVVLPAQEIMIEGHPPMLTDEGLARLTNQGVNRPDEGAVLKTVAD